MFRGPLLALALLAFAPGASAQQADVIGGSGGALDIVPIVTGLETPWSFAFLPGGRMLITERGGRLLFVDGGGAQAVAGVPDVVAQGQGGLLDVLVPRDFPETREVYLTFSVAQGRGAGTALARGRLSDDGDRLEGTETIFEIARGGSGGRHFGSRLVEARDGTLFMTIGDRGDRPSAQDLSRHEGSVLRLTRDGAPAPGNPFADTPGAQPEIWSYGHRNPQGAALDGSGQLWVHEHGARGGDEVNRVEKGSNYGWPVISYGRHYSGARIGEGQAKPGMEQPVHYWDPSIAPSGLAIYSGRLWPAWEGDMFVGSLNSDFISRVDAATLTEAERLQSSATGRVRDIREGPSGALWFLSERDGALYRITPR